MDKKIPLFKRWRNWYIVYSGETDHVIPWQTDQLLGWRTEVVNAVEVLSKVVV